MSKELTQFDRRALLRNALATIEKMQDQLSAVERAKQEPLAIVGMSCRFPGGANDPEAYWRLLQSGVDTIREVPLDRWSKIKSVASEMTWYGSFLDDIDQFDPQFFGISPREAVTMDPQQRLVLEVTWEALERAGIAPASLRGSLTGVFVGITTNDYAFLNMMGDPAELDVYTATGSALNVTAGRVAYTLGLQGASMAIDTACSSSLVAVHLACQSLRSHESNMALAGGVNVLLKPEPFICFSRWGMMAPDGRCKTFDAGADGFVRGEGCGMIVLKRLSDALADGDSILALIRGSAVNHDGRSGGLTVPNGLSQRAVIQQALVNANVDPAHIGYIETHGTGTTLGDPIEVEAIGAALRHGRQTGSQPLFLGSVKTNIGHLESASGIAGLMKVVLALQHQEIPSHLHFQAPNPKIPWPEFPYEIPVTARHWPAIDRQRLAGVSSFGFSGTNAHVILAQAPERREAKPQQERHCHLLTLSARNKTALKQLAGRFAECLSKNSDLSPADVTFTANKGRSHFAQRLGVVGTNVLALSESLGAFAAGREISTLLSGTVDDLQPQVAFLFTGQGAQYINMGRQLFESEPVFHQAMQRCDEILRPLLDRSLLSVIYPSDAADSEVLGLIDQTQYTQPSLFAFEYALAKLWESWGIVPAAVIGHSVGEYVAACIAGIFSLEDGLRLIAARGRLMGKLTAGGAMAAIFADQTQVQAVIADYPDKVSVAAINGPNNVVISGDALIVADLIERYAGLGIQSRRLAVSHAFHSPLMEPMLGPFADVAARVSFAEPRIEFVANVTGTSAGPKVLDASYWCDHVRKPVRFADGIKTLSERGYTVFLECGPQPTLSTLGRHCLSVEKTWLPSLQPGNSDVAQMLRTLAQLYVRGVNIDWRNVHDSNCRSVVLPTYPFQRQRYWLESMTTRKSVDVANSDKAFEHPLLGLRLDPAHAQTTHIWESQLNLRVLPYLNDHRVQGSAIVPATAYTEMAMAAAAEIFGRGPLVLTTIENKKILALYPDTTVSIQLVLSRSSDNTATFCVYSRPVDLTKLEKPIQDWTLHASGKVALDRDLVPQDTERFDAEVIKTRCSEQFVGTDFYQKLAEKGNEWGPSFQGIARLWRGDGESLSLVHIPESLRNDLDCYQFHPAVADACGHVLTATVSLDKSCQVGDGAFVGGGIDEVRLHRHPRGMKLWAHARLRPTIDQPKNVLTGDVRVFDETGALVSEALGAHLWYFESDKQQAKISDQIDDWIYKLQWQVLEQHRHQTMLPMAPKAWIIFTDKGDVGTALNILIQRQGLRSFLVSSGNAFNQLNENAFCVRPDQLEDFRRILKTLADKEQTDTFGIVHLWSLDASISEGSSSLTELESARNLVCNSVLCLVQGLTQIQWKKPPRLWMVTRGAQSVNEAPDPPAVAQAALWGLGRTVALEHSEIWGGLIDLDLDSGAKDAAELLYQTIEAAGNEDQIALRGSQRYVARLIRARHPLTVQHPFRCRSDASYLITGGLGGIGMAVARWLVEKGAQRLILLGRTNIPPRGEWRRVDPQSRVGQRIATVLELEARGASVHLASIDVGDENQLTSFLKNHYAEQWPPIRGVMHAAGVMQYQSLIAQDVKAMQDILKPKMIGGWLLHRLLDEPLDFYVMFSSSSALLNSPLMGSYAAANAFLDALAHYRRTLGQPALSINWGTWGEVGMALEFDSGGRQMELSGVATIPTRQGLEVLERLLQQGRTQAAVMPINWRQWQKSYPRFAQSPFLAELMDEKDPSLNLSDVRLTRIALNAAVPEERERLVEGYLAQQLAKVLGLSIETLDIRQPVSSLGFDSLMAVEIKGRIEADLGAVIPVVQFLQGSSVRQLTALLLRKLAESDDEQQSSGANGDVRAFGDATAANVEGAKHLKNETWEEGEI